MNSIMVLHPYKWNNMWVFDDEKTGLVKEPFVAGIDKILDKLTENRDISKGITVAFSGQAFPGASIVLKWLYPESGGNWYRCERLNMDGWLCPALYKYFKEAPRTIHLQLS